MLNITHYISPPHVEDHGKRFYLWVQGCHLNCPGCCNASIQVFIPNVEFKYSSL
ncbi:MAG: 4Fe-4S cluster-binding domain-containing protein [Brevinema sp.]